MNEIPNFDAGPDQFICLGDSTILNASGNANSYSWNNNYTDSSYYLVNDTTSFILTGSSLAGCSDSDTVVIFGLPLPNTFTGESDGYIN